MSKTLTATYEMIKNYRNKKTNYWLAISEFIDNSIGSYQKNDRNNPIDGLEIFITFDFKDKNNKKIIILDNAYGMDKEKLEDAMQPCDRRGKSDTQYNQYGIGMKLGIFWFGEDGLIYSKEKGKKEHKLEFFTSNVNSNQEVVVDAIESKDNKIPLEHGTYIEISKIYDERDILCQKDALNQFKDALGWRYNKLLDKGLKIFITIKCDEDKKCMTNEQIKGYFNKPFQLSQLFHKSDQINRQRREEFEKLKEKINKDLDNKSELFKNVWKKLINDEKILVEKEITINNKKVVINFGIISADRTSKKTYSGLTIYHMDRALYHGPNKDGSDNKCSNIQFVESPNSSNQSYRWLYGDLNLTGIEKADDNKSGFSWSKHGWDNLREELDEIYYKDLKDILSMIVSIDNIKSNEKQNEKSIESDRKSFSNKVVHFKNSQICQEANGEYGIKGVCEINGENISISIYESDNVEFIETKRNDETKEWTICIEREHKFWKPFINKEGFKGEMLYPVALYLGVTNLIYNNSLELAKFDPNGSKSYIEILKIIINDWSIR